MERFQQPTLGEEVFATTLPRGCDLYVYPAELTRRKFFLLCVDYGSVDLSFIEAQTGQLRQSPHGVAHFLEHRLFEKRSGDITERFSELGSEVDAQTSFTSTEYAVTCYDSMEETIALLLELVLSPQFSDEGVAREREIISREIGLFAEEVEWVSFSNAMRSLYRQQPVGIDVAGTVESLEQIDRAALEHCYETYYQPHRMSLFACGDVDVSQVCERLFDVWRSDVDPASRNLPATRSQAAAVPERHTTKLSIAQARLCLAFHDPQTGLRGEELLKRELSLEIALDILFGPASEFYSKQYESGVIDADSFDFDVFAAPEFCFCHVSGDCREPDRLEDAILDEMERAGHSDIVARDFDRAMRKAYGALLRSYDDIEDRATMICNEVSIGAHPFAFFRAYAETNAESVQCALGECLDPGSYGAATVLPMNG